jgi:hypothetical protein
MAMWKLRHVHIRHGCVRLIPVTLIPKSCTRFTDDTDMSCFVVAKNGYDLGSEWVQGEIPRRGNSFELIVRHEPQGATYAAPKVATLVVDQEDGWKWTYKIIAST